MQSQGETMRAYYLLCGISEIAPHPINSLNEKELNELFTPSQITLYLKKNIVGQLMLNEKVIGGREGVPRGLIIF